MFLLFAFGCSKETGCVDITDKSQGDGEYYFFWGYGTMSRYRESETYKVR